MPEPSLNEIVAGLLEKLDRLNLEGTERAVLWAILAAARDSVQLVDPAKGLSFQREFADAFTEGKIDPGAGHVVPAARFNTLMIVK